MANLVYQNIEETQYKITFLGLTFYFSSMVYLQKFKKGLQDYIKLEKIKNYNKYGINLIPDEFFAIAFYRKLEKRGFRVYYNSNRIKSENESFFVIDGK